LQIAIGFVFIALCEGFVVIVTATLAHHLSDPVIWIFMILFGAVALVNLRFMIGQARLAVIVDPTGVTVRDWWRTERMPLASFDHVRVWGVPPRAEIVSSPTARFGVRCGAISGMLIFQRASRVESWARRVEAAVATFVPLQDPPRRDADGQSDTTAVVS
jgi:hypothetical protein